LTEIEAYYVDGEESIEDGEMVDYNSFIDFKKYVSVNFDGD
jgi:hypothetical protein